MFTDYPKVTKRSVPLVPFRFSVGLKFKINERFSYLILIGPIALGQRRLDKLESGMKIFSFFGRSFAKASLREGETPSGGWAA